MKNVKSILNTPMKAKRLFLYLLLVSAVLLSRNRSFANPFSNVSGTGVGISSINWQWTADVSDTGIPSQDILFELRAATGGLVSPTLSPNTTSYVQRNLTGPNTSYTITLVLVATNTAYTGGQPKLDVFVSSQTGTNLTYTGTTLGGQVPTYSIFATSVAVHFISSSSLYTTGSNYFLAEIATVTQTTPLPYSTSAFTAHSESWQLNRSSAVFNVSLATNTFYAFRVRWSTGPAGQDTIILHASTRTLAVTPPVPNSLTSTGFSSADLRIATGTNTDSTEFAVLVTVPDQTDHPHHNKYLKLPESPAWESDLDLALSSAQWVPFLSGWDAGASGKGFTVTNLFGGITYNFAVKARNGDNVETATSTAITLNTLPSAPIIKSKMGITEGTWINVFTTSFTVNSSAHNHSTFTYSKANNTSELNAITTTDESYYQHFTTNSTVLVYTATAPGSWFLHVLGDGHGYNQTRNHPITGRSSFEVKLDSIQPAMTSLRAQFSSTDETPITSGATSKRRDPYFIFNATVASANLESPATGFAYLLSTGTANQNDAVGSVVNTTNTAVYFPNTSRTNETYYFKVRAKDTAGNWGWVSTFTFVYEADNSQPTVTITAPASNTETDGTYFGEIDVSPTLTITFNDDMKQNTFTTPANVELKAIKNSAGATVDTSIGISITSASRSMTITPAASLNGGWVYELTLRTGIQDLGENALNAETKIKFKTLTDPSESFTGKSNGTECILEANTLPEKAAVAITETRGSLGSAPALHENFIKKRGTPPSGYHALMFVTATSLDTAADKLKGVAGDFAQSVTIREFVALKSNGARLTNNFNKSATIILPYVDADNDGYVDGTSPKVRAKKLAVYYLDETNNVWQRVPNSTIDTTTKKVTFKVNHFSVYALFGAPDNDVSQAYAYPVPFKPGNGHKNIIFANLPTDGNIRIYTPAGELVKKIDFSATSGESTYTWNVTNDDGEDLGSDVYLYVIESGSNKKTGKLMVVR